MSDLRRLSIPPDRCKPNPRAPWKACNVCGLVAPDVVGEPPVCRMPSRCEQVKASKSPGEFLLPEHLRKVVAGEARA